MKIKILSQNYLMYSCVIFGPIVLFAMMLMFILAEGDFYFVAIPNHVLHNFCIPSIHYGIFSLKKEHSFTQGCIRRAGT
ncbi:hypothetical protein HX001_16280 [Empedobacter brevis]|uniref:Uncharacterized protein n=1 Tax=Empedobacter brevis TaxID=247 RepID=A0AAJ1V9J3_9FLAO|nr:hypothetical protein [Empedobacter brevis]